MTSYTVSPWVVIFRRDWQIFGGRFQIHITPDGVYVYHLKTKVRLRRNDFSHIIAPNSKLAIWRCKDRKPLFGDDEDPTNLVHQVRKIFAEEKVECLSLNQKLEDAHISTEETLFVEAPFVFPARSIGDHQMVHEFKSYYFQVQTKGEVTEEDVDLNDIEDGDKAFRHDIPGFVKEHEQILGQKRKVSDKLHAAAEHLVGEDTSKEYFDYSIDSMENPQSISTIDQIECCHLGWVSTVYQTEIWHNIRNLGRKAFTIDDAKSLFFYPFARHLQSASNITVAHGKGLWPFLLVMKVVRQFHYMCNFQSDFLVLKDRLPRLAVIADIPPPEDGPAEGYCRLMLQGACVVRFANTYLEAYKDERNFVFMAIFIDDFGYADRYLLYQTKGSDIVYFKRQRFEFAEKIDRIRFMLELYNLSSKLQKESKSEDTERMVMKLNQSVTPLPEFFFTSKAKLITSDDEDGQTRTSVRQNSEDGGVTDQLEACGYEVVPDVFEVAGDTWELIDKLPPHMRTVYRRGDRSKTELIAKQVCEGSNELHILEYLHAQQPRSPHIISLIEATPRVTKEWLILPQHSRCYQHVMKHGVAGRDQLGWGLIKGLAYLHEHNIAHRDINPYNLVCDSDFQLQIIDFDLAIQIQDEDTKTDEYLGAKSDWTAHEMGDKDGPTLMHSPIRADRWACGRVLLRFILVGGGNKRLWDFADELMAIRPQQRPSLLKWHELLVQRPPTWPRWPATTARDEDMEMSEAKRPRLE